MTLPLAMEVQWQIDVEVMGIIKELKACPNGKCLTIKHDQTLFGHQTFFRLDTLFDRV